MYRLWGKKMKNGKFLEDHVFELTNSSRSKEEKLKAGIESLCYRFDIQIPMWLADTEKDFAKFGKAQFFNDHFIETIDFDYFEIEVIEDDKHK